MNTLAALSQVAADNKVPTGAPVTFCIFAPFGGIGALGLGAARRALHSALFLVLTMLFRPEGLIPSSRRKAEFHEGVPEQAQLYDVEHE